MTNIRKNFIVINEEFICKNCKEKVPTLKGSCRNHCPKCLFSLHVDNSVPGDRESKCHGLMEPIALEYKGKKGYQLVHECLECGKKQLNIVAEDDDQEEVRKIQLKHSQKQDI
ncbi:MAG: RNHCP domain-containing protein [Patescibacteria group bacterium]|nr:RNHCP domain-containing protein [Patescibacteria group bacterium]